MSQNYDYSRYYTRINAAFEEDPRPIIYCTKKLLERFLPKDKSIKILDIGCGRGYLLMALQEMGYTNFIGIDIDESQIEGCIKNNVPGILVENSEDFLNQHKNEYDVIILFDVLEHISTDNTISFLANIHSALKTNGILLCKVPNANNIIASRYRYNDWTHKTSFTEYSLDFVLYNAGFENNEVFDEPHIIQKNVLSFLAHICKKIYHFFLRFIYLIEFGPGWTKIPLNLNIISISRK